MSRFGVFLRGHQRNIFNFLGLQAARIVDICVITPEEASESTHPGSLPHDGLEVDRLSFRYAESDPWILRNCSFRVEPGESVALAGASGCGKTTLAKLLLGLLTPQEGAVRIGGLDIRKYGLEAYRNLFGVVMQEDQAADA